jgi:hypothetical protein
METQSQLAATYENMSDGELLQISNEGGLMPEAKQALAGELHRRKLKASDLPQHKHKAKDQFKEETQERWFPFARYHSLGFGLYGRSYLSDADKEANIQTRTKFFVFAIPLVPIASYRFKYPGAPKRWGWWNDSDAHALGRIPIVWSQVFMTWLKAVLWIGGTLAAVVLYEKLRGR